MKNQPGPRVLEPRIDTLLRSRRRTLGLTVTERGELVVHAPVRMPLARIREAVLQKAGWILEKQAQMRARQAQKPAHAYTEGEPFWFLGERYALRYDASAVGVRLEAGALLLPEVASEKARALLESWYKQQARQVFAGRIAHYAPLLGVRCPAVRLSSARGRWGSCGAGVNLVWRLVLAPLEAVDYVVVHELAHLKYRDHSPAFYAEVGRILPGYAQQRQWLKQHGASLEV